jgi:hypothetical protein
MIIVLIFESKKSKLLPSILKVDLATLIEAFQDLQVELI